MSVRALLQVAEQDAEEFSVPDDLVEGLVGAVAVLRHPSPRRRLDLHEETRGKTTAEGNAAFLAEMLVHIKVGDTVFDDLNVEQLPDQLHTWLSTLAGGMMMDGVPQAGEALRAWRARRQQRAGSQE